VSYTDSKFFVKGTAVRLKYAVLFSSMSFEKERDLLRSFGHTVENSGNSPTMPTWARWKSEAMQPPGKDGSLRFPAGVISAAGLAMADRSFTYTTTEWFSRTVSVASED
jgi:hypothetical protein